MPQLRNYWHPAALDSATAYLAWQLRAAGGFEAGGQGDTVARLDVRRLGLALEALLATVQIGE